MIKNCERCGEPYETTVPHLARYCPKCRRIVRNETRQRRYHNNIEFERERARLRYHHNALPSPPRIKNCALCGQEFEAKTCAKYCPTCRKEKKRELARIRRKEFYEQHREQINERQRRYRAEHREQINEYQRRYRAQHIEQIRERERQHRQQERLRKERQKLIARYFAWRKRHGKS